MSEYGRYKLQCSKPGHTSNIKCVSHAEAIQAAAKERAKGFEVVIKREMADGTWEVVG